MEMTSLRPGRAACLLRGFGLACLVLACLAGRPGDAAAQAPAEADRVGIAAEPDAFAQPDPAPADRQPAGNARTTGEIFGQLWPWLVPFLAASFIALWFGIERLVVLRRARVIPRPFVERFLDHLQQGKLEPEDALKLCEENDSPVAHVFAHGIRKWGKPSVEVEQAIIDGGERQVSQLRTHLRILNGVATVAPLMGLLGTVVGMILAFNKIAGSNAMGSADQLAVDISLALVTTAAGLTIAIPSLIHYMYLAGRVDALVMEMDQLAQNVVHLISAEGLAARPPAAPRLRTRRPAAGEPAKEAV